MYLLINNKGNVISTSDTDSFGGQDLIGNRVVNILIDVNMFQNREVTTEMDGMFFTEETNERLFYIDSTDTVRRRTWH